MHKIAWADLRFGMPIWKPICDSECLFGSRFAIRKAYLEADLRFGMKRFGTDLPSSSSSLSLLVVLRVGHLNDCCRLDLASTVIGLRCGCECVSSRSFLYSIRLFCNSHLASIQSYLRYTFLAAASDVATYEHCDSREKVRDPNHG